ncbi:MAG: MCE family protein [Nocardioides sp.]
MSERIPSSLNERSRIPTSAYKMAIFTVITVLLIGLLATLIGNISFVERRSYFGTFTDATGVLKGDRVRLSGVEVGTVQGVEMTPAPDGRRHALVEFTVDEDVPLYRDVRLELRFENIVGQRYLAIEEQPPSDPAASADVLEPGAVVPVTQTSPALSLTQLFNGFQPLLRALDPQVTNDFSFQVVRAFQGEAQSFAALLSDTASLTTAIADKDQVIGEVVGNLNTVLATVSERDEELTDLIVRFRDLMTGLADDRDTISAALPGLAGLVESTEGFVREVRVPLAGTIRGIGRIARVLGVNRDVLDASLKELPRKMRLLARTGSYGSYFNFYVCGAEVRLHILGGDLYLGTPGIGAAERDSVCAKADEVP